MFAMLTISSDSQGFSWGWAAVLGLTASLLVWPATAAETRKPAAVAEPESGEGGGVEEANGDLPHFVSLRAREANLRRGPGQEFRIEWVYKRQGMPLVLLDRFDVWRQVRDPEGTVGWMHRQMLSSKRTVMIVGEARPVKDKPDAAAAQIATAEPGAVGELERCEGAWCLVDFPGPSQNGWLPKNGLWGTDLPADLSAAKSAPPANPSN
jgi:SH3-like domain-containing protein